MSYNKVISSKVIKTFNVGGKAIQGVQDEPCEALKKARDVPAGAPIAILAEKEHPSESNSKSHSTTVFEYSTGNHIRTKHVYP
ncbi:hypothetical protein PMIN01_04412 [Paraphaeosphaeria minitans]|uniref:Uncharacterized protein n=1 Tax=Paraphaeosphaeria minitans TaxID=565426 RepID=A0A9P6GK93_9PLEO|nr:hypothetical protein PMIN01_04412 [Paraphaeosphaeria minitans]